MIFIIKGFRTIVFIFIVISTTFDQVGRVFANGPEDRGSIPGRVIPKTQKTVLYTYLLNTQYYRYVSRVKWSNLGKGKAPSPTPQCSSY